MNRGLDALETIDQELRYTLHDEEGYRYLQPEKISDICDEEFGTVKRHLMALDVILEKNVNAHQLRICIAKQERGLVTSALNEYNRCHCENNQLEYGEFILVKAVLCYE